MLVLPLLIACQSPPVALAPAVGDGLPAQELASIDAAAHRIFATRPGALDDTAVRERYDAARANGLVCQLAELECLVQVGVVVGAEQMVLLRARPGAVTLAVADVSAARWLRRVDAEVAADLDASLATALTALDAAPPWIEPASPAPPPPLLALGVGGALGVVGVAAVAVGLLPFVQARSALDGLALLDAEGRAAGTARESYEIDVADTRADFDAGRRDWDGYGQALVAAGAAFVGVGVGVVVGALLPPPPGDDGATQSARPVTGR